MKILSKTRISKLWHKDESQDVVREFEMLLRVSQHTLHIPQLSRNHQIISHNYTFDSSTIITTNLLSLPHSTHLPSTRYRLWKTSSPSPTLDLYRDCQRAENHHLSYPPQRLSQLWLQIRQRIKIYADNSSSKKKPISWSNNMSGWSCLKSDSHALLSRHP